MCIIWNVHVRMRVPALISDMDCYPFFNLASICLYNRSCVLASHECLPIQMYLSTAETDVSSVGNHYTITRQCCGSNGSHKINTRAVRAVHVIHTDYCNYPSCACTER